MRVFTLSLVSAYLLSVTAFTRQTVLHQSYGTFEFEVLPFAEYQLKANGRVWLRSAPAFLNADNKRFCAGDGSLKMLRNDSGHGRDTHGPWESAEFEYSASGKKFVTSIKLYQDKPFIVFEQYFPESLYGTSVGNPNKVMSGFPRIFVGGQDDDVDLGFINYGGMMVGDTTKWMDKWDNRTVNLRDGLAGGPLALFDRNENVVVMSTFAEFMATSSQHDQVVGGTFSWGIMGSVTQVPANFVTRVIWYLSSEGINEAFSGWGNALRKEHGRTTDFVESDLINNYLGYWMDNGSYYYYNTEKGMDYEQTIYAVQDYARNLSIPYRYIQYDSWWYYEGPLKGITLWEGRPDIFPNGMVSSKTPYAKQNGGKYDFLVEALKAAPMDEAFWTDLFIESKRWGLTTYEQDWMNVEIIGLDSFKTNISMGKLWLDLMAKAAAKTGITLQYCMSNPRHAMQALRLNVVTQARVSDDYSPGRGNWKIGVTNIFAHALRLAPYKDSFWSTSVQPPYGQHETWPALHSLAATLSTGPVGPGDAIGRANVALIMRCCNADGLILKPSAPVKAIDSQIVEAAFRDGSGPDGEVWSSYSEISGFKFGLLFAASMTTGQSYIITPHDAGFKCSQFGNMVAFKDRAAAPLPAFQFDDKHPIVLESCSNDNYCLYHTTPTIKLRNANIHLYGELSKWVPMSPKRVHGISVSSDDVTATLRGGVGEVVTFWYSLNGAMSFISCRLPSSGEAILSVMRQSCA